MKRTIVLLLALLMTIGLNACGEKSAEPTVDTIDTVLTGTEETLTTEATVVACVHNMVETYYRAPNCVEQGEARCSCTICGVESVKDLPALGHEGSGASCTEVAICANCGEVAEAAWGHLDRNGICENCGIGLLGPESTENTEPAETLETAQ